MARRSLKFVADRARHLASQRAYLFCRTPSIDSTEAVLTMMAAAALQVQAGARNSSSSTAGKKISKQLQSCAVESVIESCDQQLLCCMLQWHPK
jgi:hypothetical protein